MGVIESRLGVLLQSLFYIAFGNTLHFEEVLKLEVIGYTFDKTYPTSGLQILLIQKYQITSEFSSSF
jgi:hypothetical protein